MNNGKFVFAQLTEFLSPYEFERCVARYQGHYRVRSFRCWDQFLALGFGQLTSRESIRSIITCLQSQKSKLFHLGFRSVIARKTLLDANEKRDFRIYQDFALTLIQQAKKLYAKDSVLYQDIDAAIYALDSSTIDLCLTVFRWAKFRITKAAIKLHTLLDLRGNIPTFIHITDGKYHDVNILDLLEIEAGAFYVMDKGYIDFQRLFYIHQALAFFITRIKINTKWKRVYSHPVNKEAGICCDQTILFTGFYATKNYPEKIRRIKYYDKEQKKYYVFLTNNFVLDAKIIADLYKSRWQVELFFKWIKQHLRVKVFWGESSNAVKTQIWIAISMYVLVAIVKKKLQLEQSLYEILQILSVCAFDKIKLQCLFAENELQISGGNVQKPLF